MTESLRAGSDDASELRCNWRVLVAATLGTGLGFPGVPFYTVGIFAPILASEFNWSMASIFGGLSLVPIGLLVGGPLVGYLVDRHGARTVAASSLAGFGVCYVSLALSTGSVAQYYASWIALTVAGMGATPVPFTRAVSSRFVERRGLALGITLAGVGLFAMFVKPLAAWLLEVVGWRWAIVAIGALPLAVGAPIVLWGMRSRDSPCAAAGVGPQRRGPGLTGLTVSQALRARSFWTLVLAFPPIAFALGAPLPHMENILRSLRIAASDVVALTSLIGAAMVAGRLLGGWVLDRAWAPLVGASFLIGAALASWMLSGPGVSHREASFAIVLLGFAGGVEVDLLSFLVARYIGVRSYGVVYGTIFGLLAIGAGAGPGLIGHTYDRTGSYAQSLQLGALLLILAACLLISLGRYPSPAGATSGPGAA